MNFLLLQTEHPGIFNYTLIAMISNSLGIIGLLSIAFLLSSCSSTEPLITDEGDNNKVKIIEEEMPSIAGFIEFINVTADDDTVRTRLSDASLSVRDLDGLPLSSTSTNIRGEFFIELDAFRPGEQYDLFVYSSSNRIIRNIRFIYTIEKSNEIELVLDRDNRTEMNIDYLDLNTGEGRGEIITN